MKIALMRLARFALCAFALVVFLFFVWPVFDMIRNQVTVYPIFKTDGGKLVPANPSVYKVFPETQNVIYWMPGISEAPKRLTNCSVRDRLNWRCEYSDGSGVLTMENGIFSDKSTRETYILEFTYTSRLNWWRLSF